MNHLVGATFFFAQWVIGVVVFAQLGLRNVEAIGAGLAVPIGVGAAMRALTHVKARRAQGASFKSGHYPNSNSP